MMDADRGLKGLVEGQHGERSSSINNQSRRCFSALISRRSTIHARAPAPKIMTATKESSAVPAHKGLSRMAKIVITGIVVTAAAAGAAIAVVAPVGVGRRRNGAKGIKFYSALENDVNASDAIGAMQYVIVDPRRLAGQRVLSEPPP